ncbi:MAG TPA: sodium/solute symporter [Phycisphaerae bacterium]|nr:sodium/solute symporter [Phycisphaerae bacterium]
MISLPLAMETAGAAGFGSARIETIDVVVMIAYIISIVGLGCWVGLRHRKKGGEAKDYFLAGKTLRWPIIGLALFATNISCVHLVSLAQAGFDSGLLLGNFEWMAAFTLVMLGLFFAPFYIRSRVATLPDFLERRYNRACRDWLAVLSMVSAVIIHIGFSFLTGGKVLEALFGMDIYHSIIIIAALTALYTIIGGLMAVVITEGIQTIIMVIGASVIAYFAWDAMGGWEPMKTVLSLENVFGENDIIKTSMLRPPGDASGMPWYAIFLGYPVLGIWYWCADQTIVQRVLGARDENHARVGPLFAGLIKILPVFIFVMPGLFAFTLYQTGKLKVSDTAVVKKGEINLSHAIQLTTDPLNEEQVGKLTEAGLYQDGAVTDVQAALDNNLIDADAAKILRARQRVAAYTLAPEKAAALTANGFYEDGNVEGLTRAVEAELIDRPTAEFLKAKAALASFKLDGEVLNQLKTAGLYDEKSHVVKVDKAVEGNVISPEAAAAIRTYGDAVVDSKGIYGVMITQLLPPGLTGVMVAALLAALMSTVAGALNSISTLFSFDLYKRFKPEATDHKLVWIGRVTAGVAVVVAIGLVPLLDSYESIFKGLNDIIAHIAPPVTCVFMLGVFWKRASAVSAKLTLWFGSGLGALVFATKHFGGLYPEFGELAAVQFIMGIPFMMMAFYLLCACVAMQVTFSLIWPVGESERASKLYWETPFEPLKDKGWPGLGDYRVLAFLLIVVMVVLYYFFR